jgi:hypothetical protein
VPDGIEDLVIVHPSGRVHRFQFERPLDEPNEDLTEVTRDKAHRIRFPLPKLRKVLRFTPPADVGSVELMGESRSYDVDEKKIKAARELVHTEQLGGDDGDRLVVDMPLDVSSVIMERNGHPWRQVDLEDRETEDEPDPESWHTLVDRVDIPFDVDLVRVDFGPGGGPDVTFSVRHAPDKDSSSPRTKGDKSLATGGVELVLSNLPGGHEYFRLEFAHPDGEHFTEVDLMDDFGPTTCKRSEIHEAEEAETPTKAKRTRVRRKKK